MSLENANDHLPIQHYTQVIYTWNQTNKDYPSNKTIHQLFEEQVAKTPDNIAVVYKLTSLTYKELNERANRLAHYLLIHYSIIPDTLVALLLDKSEHILISILAVLKAGGVYVPIDTNYPDERIAYILKDTEVRVVLTNEVHKKRLSKITETIKSSILALDNRAMQKELEHTSFLNPTQASIVSTNLAYIIYTSGTTGNPKGVMVEHRSCIALNFGIKELYFNDLGVINAYSITSYTFDIFGLEYMLPLSNGGSVYLGSSDFSLLDCSIYHFIQMTPSLCSVKLNCLVNTSHLRLLVGGENLTPGLLSEVLRKSIDVVNVYGPTETTIWSTSKLYTKKQGLSKVSLGSAFPNEQTYVLDTKLSPVPIGTVGELYIGGVGLARGYLNRPDLTKERFIRNPFQTAEEKNDKSYGQAGRNARIYKTGDLVNWLPDGSLEYVGRNDFQVKIRGYRVELGEIESILSSYEGIQQGVVLAKERLDHNGKTTNNKYLVAYCVAQLDLQDKRNHIDAKKILINFTNKVQRSELANNPLVASKLLNNQFIKNLKAYLGNKLPKYMVPEHYILLDKFPLTINGKLDRKALPDPEFGGDRESYVASCNELERKLCAIWADVLGIPEAKVGIHDDFFKLGGDSILAIRLVSKVNRELKFNLNIAALFSYRTISQLVSNLGSFTEKSNEIIPLSSVTRPEEQLLSFGQKRLWFIEKYEGGSSAYNIPLVFILSDDVILKVLESSIISVVRRHEILRTFIKEDDYGNGYQEVLDSSETLNVTYTTVHDQAALHTRLVNDMYHVYNLTTELPIKASIYKLIHASKGQAKYYLHILIHHIAFDGWSSQIFMRDLVAYYNYHLSKTHDTSYIITLPKLPIQYKDFAFWQRNYLRNQEIFDIHIAYWKNRLIGYQTLNLLSDFPRPNKVDYRGSSIYFDLDKGISTGLESLAKALGVSLYSTLLSGYYLMFSVYSNQNDIVIGTPVANRHYSQVEDLVGFFVNTLALRMHIKPQVRIRDFILSVGQEVIEAQLHQDLPFEKLVSGLNVAQDTNRHPIFQVWFSIQSVSNQDVYMDGLLRSYSIINDAYNVAKFDISLFIDDDCKPFRCCINYAKSVYKDATMLNFIETYKHIMKQIAALANNKTQQLHTSVSNLDYLTPTQYNNIIYNWNDSDTCYPIAKTIHQLFEEQAERTPGNIAIVYEETKLTYRQLNERTNQLANYLRDRYEISPDTLIVLCLNRSEHMLIAILGVLKAGGAYVPMDPSYPDERIQYVLEDTNTKLVLTNEAHKERLAHLIQQSNKDTNNSKLVNADYSETMQQVGILAIDANQTKKQLNTQPIINPNTTTTSTNLAYVIYTSGTTGKPKGVMIEHTGVVNLKYSLTRLYNLGYKDNRETILQVANYVFDASIEQIVLSLMNGFVLVIMPEQIWLDQDRFYEYLNINKITHIHATPTFLEQYDLSKILTLKRIIAGGELLSKYCYNNIALSNNSKIINEYGPTEVSITAIVHVIENDNSAIGKPIANTKCYVLSSNLKPLPIGAIGELYIAGVGLARGYLNKPELTAEQFIDNPFQTENEQKSGKNAKLYKTGDLVRWLPDGNLDYIGRNDFQVKIRGYRIELGEIESVISSFKGIKQNVVLAKDRKTDNDANEVSDNGPSSKYLVGYYVSGSGEKLDEEAIRSYLQTKLPSYMVPSVLVHLEKFPLTINGKLDRKTLPNPDLRGDKESYVAPRNDLERKLCAIWAEVLGLSEEKVGMHDDFFRLGGDSIIAIKLVNRINKILNVNINIALVFNCRDISRLVYSLDSFTERPNQIIFPSNVSNPEEQLLSFSQERLWFIEKYEGGSSSYNIPLVFRLSISDMRSLQALEDSIIGVVERHEVLRSLIKEDSEGQCYQESQNLNIKPFNVERIIVSSEEELTRRLIKGSHYIYDLSSEYPIKAYLYGVSDNLHTNQVYYHMHIIVHHIAFDGWSTDILLHDLHAYYLYYSGEHTKEQVEATLPRLPIQYKDFALWQRHHVTSDKILNIQLAYWKGKLKGYETLNLSPDLPRPKRVNYKGNNIHLELGKETSARLRNLAKKLEISLYSLLLSGYYLMLRIYSNQNDIVVGVPVANRHYSQVGGLIGCFVNSLALRIRIKSNLPVRDFIIAVGREVVEAQLHQDLPFEKIVDELRVPRDTSKHPIFQVMFVAQRPGTMYSNETIHCTSPHKALNFLEKWSDVNNIYKISKFDLETFIDDSLPEFKCAFHYAVNLYRAETITRYAETYGKILEQFAGLLTNSGKLRHIKVQDINS